ncbi:MAG: PTS sugar transporter subunit IIA [Planctomycetes bacterium]|nr:PTS sugar transporter subunit IIA [Planctomycetota bacterium]MCH9725379.1 PTS sugar transporter subunit IIA [Planctomycetota bacterium]MCH9775237.1 PTS sugar transporter subunit IIA [Planctomycetota bacterium]MCH9791502.1 PTS sugar transporter subunit IIA [Planctomycetota bacterium]
MKRLKDAFSSGHVVLDIAASDMESAIREAIRQSVAEGMLPEQAKDQVVSALLRRETEAPTTIGHASAIPHAYLDVLTEPLIIFVRLAHPVNAGAPDGIPVQFLFVLLGPPGAAAEHLDTLASIARLLSNDEFRYDLGRAGNRAALLEALQRFVDQTELSIPPVAKKGIGLEYTGRLFGGFIDDVRRRSMCYASDFRDGLNSKSLSSTLFLFFACLAPAVTFGGIMGVETGGQIGVVEMLVASAFCGIVYAICSGQPLIILGGVGPLLVFTGILYRLSADMQLPFLSTYAWVGFWTALLLVILAATDASCLMRYFTRFTDEIFSVLMALIFIYEAVRAIVATFRTSFADATHHDAAFLSLMLALGTFYIGMTLSRFRRSNYLVHWMREFLADFGPMLALAAMTLLAWWLRTEVSVNTLEVPGSIQTSTGRTWLVDPFETPIWARWAALGPAMLAAVLVYLTQNITGRLVNSPDHKLQKAPAYHLDLAVVGILIGVCSLFGLPWLVAATVRSLAHVRGLATTEEVIIPGGGTQERVIHVQENRVTGLAIHVLIALSLLALPLLKVVPMAVLYGVFLYMGVVSLTGNQFFERLTLWLTDPGLYPRTHYLRQAPTKIIHHFTLVQLVCLVILCCVTLSPNASLRLSFPLFIALLVPVRLLVDRVFDDKHLAALDVDETPQEEETHWSA